MKRLGFEPPTDYYDERLEAIDEQICALIKQRKDLSSNNPGFPTKNRISSWSKKFNFYEDFLNGLFSHLLHEEMYKPKVEPGNFVKNIPILKSFEKDEVFYSVTFIRQYENASVVHFTIDKEEPDDYHRSFEDHTYFELTIDSQGTDYDSRNEGGGGSRGHTTYTYMVSPALPEDLSGLKCVFKEFKAPSKATGFEIVI